MARWGITFFSLVLIILGLTWAYFFLPMIILAVIGALILILVILEQYFKGKKEASKRMSEERQTQKVRTKRFYVAILLIGIALTIIIVYPTPHTYSVTEPVYGYVTRTARDLERTLNTDGVLGDGDGWGWSLYDLSDGTLYIVVDISSTKILHVEIEDKTGEILNPPRERPLLPCLW